MVAAGTHPNTIYEREIRRDVQTRQARRILQGHRVENGKLVQVGDGETGFLTS